MDRWSGFNGILSTHRQWLYHVLSVSCAVCDVTGRLLHSTEELRKILGLCSSFWCE